MVAKRAPSAYFVFANEQRASTKEELLASAPDNKAPSVADIAKSIGHKWRALEEAGQQAYKDKAAVLAADAAAIAAAAATEHADDDRSQPEIDMEADADHTEVPGLPLTSIKRIMCTDEDVARISGDCVKAVAKATEMFIQLLAIRAHSQAKQHKRSTIKFCDIHHAAVADKRMVEMGLKDMFAHEALFADAREGKENMTAAKKNCKVATELLAARPITDFFKA